MATLVSAKACHQVRGQFGLCDVARTSTQIKRLLSVESDVVGFADIMVGPLS